MALDPFCTPEDVRAVLGLNSKELPDETLGLAQYEANLRLELDKVGEPDNDGTLIAAFKLIAEKAEDERSAAEVNLHAAVILFAPYVVALHCFSSIPLLTQRAVTDGKAGISRHAESPFEGVKRDCKQLFERFRQNIEKRWATYQSTTGAAAPMPTLFLTSEPGSDPIEGA